MKLKKFKERDNKRIGIIVFTLVCILLVSGVILYRTFAIFEVKTNQNIINGEVQGMGDLEFAFYKDNDIVKEVPKKSDGYSLDTSSSYCIDLLNNQKVSNVNWDNERWGPYLSNITTTKTKCYLHFKKIYQEEELHGAIPDLGNGRLVPVTISETDGPDFYTGDKGGNVYKADITSDWYKYADKKWANAIILKDGVVDNYSPGEQIPEENIESYFVWIPRYSYKLQNNEETFSSYSAVENKGQQANVQSFYEAIKGNKGESNAFEIEFGSKDKGISTTLLSKGDSIVHPAFEAFDSNGFWVGKFETGYNQNNDGSVMPPNANSWNTAGAQHNETNSTKVIIKPNVYSWRGIQVANAFYTSYHYQRDLESHMMKNTEWGAVAYLTQSKYGRCEEKDGGTTCDEVRINNSQSFITGMSATYAPTCGYTNLRETCNIYETLNSLYIDGGNSYNYYNKESKVASTTGNYTGVYDMAGGALEYVMGVMLDKDGKLSSGRNDKYNSNFVGTLTNPEDGEVLSKTTWTTSDGGIEWPNKRYYDTYNYSDTDQNFNKGLFGDGTKEFGPFYQLKYNGTLRRVGGWNADAAFFVAWGLPWFIRGGDFTYGTDAGIAAFNRKHGDMDNSSGFRIVLTP